MTQVLLDNLLHVGKVIRRHGFRGLLRVWSYAQSETLYQKAGAVYLKPLTGELYEYNVISLRPHKNIYLMELDGICSGDEAEKYRGAEIFVRKNALTLREDEYYWDDLLGLKALDRKSVV